MRACVTPRSALICGRTAVGSISPVTMTKVAPPRTARLGHGKRVRVAERSMSATLNFDITVKVKGTGGSS
ncbi:hypothetical protein CTE05_28820 [Cellulomonas terrae]|uniref:Uncharacterized protein n=1 Tax=Cellulomonas terrae TaxID=311234 RepID=A0A511JNA0_9CELL|nr:hypothetical protein CTE05_28820 [Cellulomonas terrae]